MPCADSFNDIHEIKCGQAEEKLEAGGDEKLIFNFIWPYGTILYNNFYMQVKNGRNKENEMYQNFKFHFHISENAVFVVSEPWGKSLFLRTCIAPVHNRSLAVQQAIDYVLALCDVPRTVTPT